MNQHLERWVDEHGTDAYGHWATFSVTSEQGNKVTQRLRWIEPGTFLMGSPENEPGRWDTESPQHQVTLTQGFWLFDTACTQALWQAMMGENPSQFKGANHPVECISWNDCQDFLKRLNERLPGINLELPSEAQWEYACRAGTTTPFSFGTNITQEQVNYDDAFSYVGAKPGTYRVRNPSRRETIPVASLPPNQWGLYEMHGNVCEWTQDHWHNNYQGAPADGSAWVDSDTGADRVIRGGSWLDYARYVRAAYRDRHATDYCYDGLGFRCTRVQPSQVFRGGSWTDDASDVSAAYRYRPVTGLRYDDIDFRGVLVCRGGSNYE